jgi:hypothetical protein
LRVGNAEEAGVAVQYPAGSFDVFVICV